MYNKGDALLNLGKILGISMEQIMACGDGNNDLEMVRNAGVGVAMENGEDSVKEAADYVTVTNDEEGVARAIDLFCDLQLKERISEGFAIYSVFSMAFLL